MFLFSSFQFFCDFADYADFADSAKKQFIVLQKSIYGSAKKTVQIYAEAGSNANLFAQVQ